MALAAFACVAATGCAAPEEDPAEEASDSVAQASHADSFLIKNAGTGLCLDGYNGGGNTRPYMFKCNTTNQYQRWRFVSPKGNPGQICNLANGLCLDGFVNFLGGNPYLFQNLPANIHQQWTLGDPIAFYDNLYPVNFHGSGELRARLEMIANGKRACLDGYAGLGLRPYLYNCDSNNVYQKWAFWRP